MRIVTLGTSHGDPTPGHYCTSVLIQAGGRHYLLDAGEPANATLVSMGMRASMLYGIFVTHMHIDHTGGLPVLCEQAEKYRGRFPEVELKVLLPEDAAVAALASWRMANHTSRFLPSVSVAAYCPGMIYDDGLLSAEAIPTRHIPHPEGSPAFSHAIKISAEGKNVLFTGDLAADFGDFPLGAAQGCAAVFSEITHYHLDKAVPVFEQLQAGRLVFYHIHNPWQTPEGQAKALDMCAKAPMPVQFAFDGFELEL